jgi:stress response protein YsnF
MMFSFGRASQQILSAYAPRAELAVRTGQGAGYETASSVEVIPIGEETLNVGTRRVAGETTRVRRVVVETPVEQGIALREERVIVERRKPTGAPSTATQAILTDTAVEMSDSFEVVDVWKSVRVTEEVVLRREVTERHETVRDTVRRDEVFVEQARPAISALHSEPRHEFKAAQPERKSAAPVSGADKPEPAQMAADLKKVAERFETSANQHDKPAATPRPETSASKTDPSLAASSLPKTSAEQTKASGRPDSGVAQHDKGNASPKA